MVELKHAMLCWDSETNRAKVVPHPDFKRQSDEYQFTTGACWSKWDLITEDERLLRLMIEAWQAVVRDGITVEIMHEALLAIPEFREAIAGDVRGSKWADVFALPMWEG